MCVEAFVLFLFLFVSSLLFLVGFGLSLALDAPCNSSRNGTNLFRLRATNCGMKLAWASRRELRGRCQKTDTLRWSHTLLYFPERAFPSACFLCHIIQKAIVESHERTGAEWSCELERSLLSLRSAHADLASAQQVDVSFCTYRARVLTLW